MANPSKLDALTELRGLLAVHAKNPFAKAYGLSTALQKLDAVIVELTLRQSDIANACLILERDLNDIGATSFNSFTSETRSRLTEIFEAGRK